MDENERREIVQGVRVIARHGLDAMRAIKAAVASGDLSQDEVDEVQAQFEDIETA